MLTHLEKSWTQSLIEAYKQLKAEKGEDQTPVNQDDAENLARTIYSNALTTADVIMKSTDVFY